MSVKLTTEDLENLSRPEQAPGHFDPNDELTMDEIDECSKRVEDRLKNTNCQELNLMKSKINVPGQEWALVSFVGEDLSQKTKDFGMKIWGVFPDIKSAKEHSEKISKDTNEKKFDVYILELYSWAMIPPRKEYIEDQVYHEEKLHEIITERKRQQDLATEIFDTRKQKLMNNPDKNEFERNKAELKELMDTKVGGDFHRKIFGDPKKLPKMEILDEDDEIISTSQGLTESNEDFKKRLAQNEKLNYRDTSTSEHADKFYNK